MSMVKECTRSEPPREIPRAQPRSLRRAHEFGKPPQDIAGRLHEEFTRLIREGRCTSIEVFMAVTWLCDDFDRSIEHFSVSWAEIQRRAVGGDEEVVRLRSTAKPLSERELD